MTAWRGWQLPSQGVHEPGYQLVTDFKYCMCIHDNNWWFRCGLMCRFHTRLPGLEAWMLLAVWISHPFLSPALLYVNQ